MTVWYQWDGIVHLTALINTKIYFLMCEGCLVSLIYD